MFIQIPPLRFSTLLKVRKPHQWTVADFHALHKIRRNAGQILRIKRASLFWFVLHSDSPPCALATCGRDLAGGRVGASSPRNPPHICIGAKFHSAQSALASIVTHALGALSAAAGVYMCVCVCE